MEMIEVYKTDVDDPSKAQRILEAIRRAFPGSEASFDLDDCDKVLRVEYAGPNVQREKLTLILERFDYQVEPLL